MVVSAATATTVTLLRMVLNCHLELSTRHQPGTQLGLDPQPLFLGGRLTRQDDPVQREAGVGDEPSSDDPDALRGNLRIVLITRGHRTG
jgi:hypothetical protein